LDLGDIANASSPRLRSCLSIPLTWNEELIGVLSLYSTATEFTDEHRRIVEAVGEHTAHTFRRGEEFDTRVGNRSRHVQSTRVNVRDALNSAVETVVPGEQIEGRRSARRFAR
jgi:GAF domain-containing protein